MISNAKRHLMTGEEIIQPDLSSFITVDHIENKKYLIVIIYNYSGIFGSYRQHPSTSDVLIFKIRGISISFQVEIQRFLMVVRSENFNINITSIGIYSLNTIFEKKLRLTYRLLNY